MPLQLRSWILIPREISSEFSIKDSVTDPSGPPVRLSRERIISDLIIFGSCQRDREAFRPVQNASKRVAMCSSLRFIPGEHGENHPITRLRVAALLQIASVATRNIPTGAQCGRSKLLELVQVWGHRVLAV